MGMGNYSKSKFVFAETFNNSNGKTSGSGFVGVIMGLVAVLGFLSVLAGWWMGKTEVLEVFDKVLQLGLLSAALLGVRKFTGNFVNPVEKKPEVSNENEPKDESLKG
jgi:hypothetical protein